MNIAALLITILNVPLNLASALYMRIVMRFFWHNDN